MEKTRESGKKLLENPFIGSLVVPIAIVLVGALVVMGVTRMLSTDRSYKDLVTELESKTFGNKWVAAYELSKLLASQSIPKEDHPWLIQNLGEIYDSKVDAKTRNFLIVALGSLKSKEIIPFMQKALKDPDSKIQFHALSALGNLESVEGLDWSLLHQFFDGDDQGLKHAAVFVAAQHRHAGSENKIINLLKDDNLTIRYAASTALVNYQNQKTLPLLKEILELEKTSSGPFNEAQIRSLKLNVIQSLKRNQWKVLKSELQNIAQDSSDPELSVRAKEFVGEY